MTSIRILFACILAAAIGSNLALAQRVNPKGQEPAKSSGGAVVSGGAGTSLSQLPAVSLTPSFTAPSAPQLILTQPVIAAPAPAPYASAPPACYSKTQDDCAAEASRCLAEEFISTNYEIRWDSNGPYVSRIYAAGEDEEARATDCASDLYRCLQPAC